MKPITAAMLKNKGACQDQVELFVALEKGGAISMTVETAVLFADRFDWDWAAENLLPAPLLKAYEEAEAPLWKAYEEAEVPLLKAYEEAEAPLLKAYEEARAPLLKAYEEARAPLLKAYKEAKARLFAELYLSQE